MHRHTRIAFTVALVIALLVPAALGQVADYRKIKYPDLPDFKIPRPEVVTLDNGMTVFLMEDRELPLIEVNSLIRMGSHYEPADKVGLAQIYGQVLREGGTSSHDPDAIDDFLAARAASIETFVGDTSGFASMNCLKEDFDDVFAMFNRILREPTFAEDRIELAKQQAKTNVARRNDDAAAIASREFQRAVYGADSPMGRMVEYATIAAIERDDLVAWHRKYVHPNNIFLGVLGDFDAASMRRTIEQAYADWKRGPELELPEPSFAPAAGGLHFVERDDVNQAYIRMGHIGIKIQNPDYFAVEVLNNVMSGGFASRFFSSIRSTQGLAYSVSGNVNADYVEPGLFLAQMSTKSEQMAKSVDALRKEIVGMIENPATDEELRRAKESILNSFVFNFDSSDEILGQQMTYAFYGMPQDFLETYQRRIAEMTAAEVNRAAKKYLKPEQLITLVVGNSADFDQPISSLGTPRNVDVAIAPPPADGPQVVRNAGNLAAGKALIERMASKLAVDPLQSYELAMDVSLSMGGQKIGLSQTVAYVAPDKLRQAMNTPMGEQVVVVNGDKGVMLAGGQRQPLPAPMIERQLKEMNRDLLVLAAHADDPKLEAVAVGKDASAGCDLVAVTLNEMESVLCIDALGRVLRQEYQGNHPLQQTPGKVAWLFSEHAQIGEIDFPMRRVMLFDGSELATATLTSLTFNAVDVAQLAVD